LPNTNENTTVAKFQKFFHINKLMLCLEDADLREDPSGKPVVIQVEPSSDTVDSLKAKVEDFGLV
jgi:hypothetical protein